MLRRNFHRGAGRQRLESLDFEVLFGDCSEDHSGDHSGDHSEDHLEDHSEDYSEDSSGRSFKDQSCG